MMTTIHLTQEIIDELDVHSARVGASRSHLIRMAIGRYLEAMTGKPILAAVRRPGRPRRSSATLAPVFVDVGV